MAQSRHSTSKARMITVCGVLTALSVALQYLEIPIPIMPSFIKFDFSDLPALIGAFAYGPAAGIAVSLLKNLIHLVVSQSGFVGELSNFILSSAFSGTAGLLYRFLHTKRGAFFSGTIASFVSAAICYPLNLFVIYPLYYSVMGIPKPAVLDMYQVILPSVKNIPMAILIFNVPFTFLKGMISVGIAMLLYKRLTGLLFTKTAEEKTKDLLIHEVERYQPYNEQEQADKQVLLSALQNEADIFLRSNLSHHMTASAWVVNKTYDKVLMVYHKIYNSWSWLGGHADGDKDLLAVAIREVQEESGIKNVVPLSCKIYSLEALTVDGHEKRGSYVPSHLHLNVTYLLQADDAEELKIKEDENSGVAWFGLDEALQKSTEPWFVERIYKKLNEKLPEYIKK